MKTKKPWGEEMVIIEAENYGIKELNIKPNHRLSLQYHKEKEETMIVLMGSGEIEISHEKIAVSIGAMVHIKPNELHRVTAGEEGLYILEVYSGELDTIRVEDDYGRCRDKKN